MHWGVIENAETSKWDVGKYVTIDLRIQKQDKFGFGNEGCNYLRIHIDKQSQADACTPGDPETGTRYLPIDESIIVIVGSAEIHTPHTCEPMDLRVSLASHWLATTPPKNPRTS